MTKKHFVALASEIARLEDKAERYACFQVIARVAEQFNPSFDRVRFLRACGLGV
jgi:hypothetical protein